ncbi:MAG: hypothetical protein IPP28_07250, partial [Xanthomonadales bacterium]|nr:hypothetical protein [Xanthomonadales bacterium]
MPGLDAFGIQFAGDACATQLLDFREDCGIIDAGALQQRAGQFGRGQVDAFRSRIPAIVDQQPGWSA